MRNQKETNTKELFVLLGSISKYLDRKIKFYALGGTALTILNIKISTIDIDIDISTRRDYDLICDIFENIGFQKIGAYRWKTHEGLFFDLFLGSKIFGTELMADYRHKSKFIASFGSIDLYTLSLEDIIISKLARGDSRDFSDIRDIFLKEKIDLEYLVYRYKLTAENSTIGNYKQKLLDLIEIQFSKWEFVLDHRLIAEVKKWE